MRKTIVAVLLLAAGYAWGDGYFAKEAARNALQPKPVAIPSQRAIVSFRDGVEKLVVESALDAEGQSFGWILPVPAKPTAYAEAPPGLLRSFSATLKPERLSVFDYYVGRSMGLFTALAVATWAAIVLIRGVRLRYAALTLIPAVFVACVTCGILTSPRGLDEAAGTGASNEPVVVEAQHSVGGYDVFLLDADTPAALNGWLESNAFARLPERGDAIVEDYIREGWRFVAVRLRREGDGLCRPHPLQLSFPAKEPIYPMRLTALAESKVDLELIVVAKGRASNPLLPCEVSDTFLLKNNVRPWYARDDQGHVPGFQGDYSDLRLAHTRTGDYLWNGCTVTKLAGTLSPAQMQDDLRIGLSDPKPFRQRLHDARSASDYRSASAFWTWSAVVAVGVLALRPRRLGGRGRAVGGLLVVLLGAAAAVGMDWSVRRNMFYLEGSRYTAEVAPYSRTNADELVWPMAEAFDGFHGRSRAEIITIIKDYDAYARPLAGGRPPLQFGETPGGIDFTEAGGDWTAVVYDSGCIPTTRPLLGARRLASVPAENLLFPCDAPGQVYDQVEQWVTETRHLDPDTMRFYTRRHIYEPALIPALYACMAAPERCVEPFVRHLRGDWRVLGDAGVAFESSVLALVTRTVPPKDLFDRAQMDAFLTEVEARRGMHASAEGGQS